MTVWESLVGQQTLVIQLRREAATNNPAQAWLFTGPPGSGRSTAAQSFAAALECTRPSPEDRGCGECRSCREVLARSHPDVTFVNTDGIVISIDQVRRLVARAQDAPAHGKRRVIIIEDADRMQEKTMNVLLKAIEEPPPRALWMLCAPTADDVPITIRSRCRKAILAVPDPTAVAKLLVEQEGAGFEESLHVALLSQSHIGIARRLIRDRKTRDRRENIVSLPLKLKGIGGAFRVAEQLLEAATAENTALEEERALQEKQRLFESFGVPEESGLRSVRSRATLKAELKKLETAHKRRVTRNKRDALDLYLIDLQSLYRDVLLTQLHIRHIDYVNGHLKDRIQTMADAGRPEDTLAKIDAIRTARHNINHNADLLLTLEAMALKLL